ncbi:MAG: flagellar protein FlaG [Proteobacteria bacterium]|nr:flagellar protein FlaG [Pseudomonadota bacterium]MBU1388926.1 flagellar protein FlaG [Pseudomonadota bacterium]MBU1543478.1 flagellar protein FlaG [Pseudomonadota bacterium]MBU2431027.1 flagellar protein FlaG [Pseudomonadota bacterium]MBU2480230.1 flagellar protein FlaG [Pseudomonadota bacterium]
MNINTSNQAIKDTGQVEKTMSSATATFTLNDKKNSSVKEQESRDKQTRLSVKDTRELAKEMNEIMDDLQTSLGFSVREGLNNLVVVEITDRKTNEVIKQIPSEELLTIKEKMEEFTGLIFDQSV